MPVQRCCGRAASIPGRAESPDAFLATLRSVPRTPPRRRRARSPPRRGVARRPERARVLARPRGARACSPSPSLAFPRPCQPSRARARAVVARSASSPPRALGRCRRPPRLRAPPRSRPSPRRWSPPLPLDDRSPPQRDAPPAPGAAGHDGRWNARRGDARGVPRAFPHPRGRAEAVRRGEIRVAEPHHESNAPAPSAPASSAPASSAPAPSSRGAAITALAPALSSPSRGARRRPRDGPERPPALRDPPGDRVRGRAHCAIVVKPEGRAHGRRRGVDRGERPAVRPRAGGRVGGRAAAAEADAQADKPTGAAALRQDEARAGNPRGGVRGEASDQEVQGAAVRRRER